MSSLIISWHWCSVVLMSYYILLQKLLIQNITTNRISDWIFSIGGFSLWIFVNECFECSIENSFQDPPTVEPAIILGLSLTAVLFVLVVCCLYWKFIYPNRHNLYRLPFIKHFHRADNGKHIFFLTNYNIHRYFFQY